MIETVYDRLLQTSLNRVHPSESEVISILSKAEAAELSLEEVNLLANAIYAPDFPRIKDLVLGASSRIRASVFGDKVIVMAPIEVSNSCASDCSFCGWRASNQAMRRLRISDELVLDQVNYLVEKGIHYLEFVGGDDLHFVRDRLPALIGQTRQLADRLGIRLKICFCTMALTESQYRRLKELGADSMIVWQETYDPACYRSMIQQGPKGKGIDDDWALLSNGSGYSFRLHAQERALKAGLEVALGAMLGMNDNLNLEILATISHARSLIDRYPISADSPLIIGMPIWNHIPTSSTDMRPVDKFVVDAFFSYLAAVLFLSLPKGKAWIFPNCRVSLEDQIEAVKVAGVFTSTEVKLGPGGYLPALLKQKKQRGEEVSPLLDRILGELDEQGANADVLEDVLNQKEQFCHHYHSHETYVARMKDAGLRVLTSPVLE